MRRRLVVSALFGLGLLAVTATGQPPGGADTGVSKKAVGPGDPLDTQIAAALAHDPDVRMAQAKVQLAEAELAKARQQVLQKVVTLNGAIGVQKRAVETAQEDLLIKERLHKNGNIPLTEVLPAREKLEAARAELNRLENELKLLTGGGPKVPGVGGMPNPPENKNVLGDMLGQPKVQAIGPIPAKIRAALDKRVKLGAKGEKVTFEKALEVFKKEAGLDAPVRGHFPRLPPEPNMEPQYQTVEIATEGEEMPVGAWFQLFEDLAVFRPGPHKYQFYVREYGILIATKDTAPPDALTIAQFWKQVPAPQ
jgi:hypothetical protein